MRHSSYPLLAAALALVLVASHSASAQEHKPRRGLPFFGVAKVDDALRNPQASLEPGGAASPSSDAPPEFKSIMSTCGTSNDWQEVELYNGTNPPRRFVTSRQPAVAQLQWKPNLGQILAPRNIKEGNVKGERWCTGTMISSKHLITAAHCFEPHDDPQGWKTPRRQKEGGGTELLPAKELAPLMQLNFRYQVNGNDSSGKVRVPDVYPIVKLLEYGFDDPKELDYAIVEVGPGADGRLPDARYGTTAFDASDAALDKAKLLTIIQHPHGMPKKVMAGPKAGIDGPILLYKDLDTLGGSSGSGVIDEAGKLIAVHIAGGCDQWGGANQGVTLKAVRQVSKIIK